MKAVYEHASQEVRDMVERVINLWPDKFIHIVPTDLAIVFKEKVNKASAENPNLIKAKTRLLSGSLQLLTKKKVLIEILKSDWETSSVNHKALLVYHELYHILFDDKKREYRLRKADVKGFFELLQTLGLAYENADTFFSQHLSKNKPA